MASTVAYTSAAQVNSVLPRSYSATDLPVSTDTTYTSLATNIVKASREVDAALAPYFCTFNAHDHSTYPCPQYIQQCATYLAASQSYNQLGVGGRYESKSKEFMEKAQLKLDYLMNIDTLGSSPRFYVLPNETVSSETLTFGAGGEFDLTEYEAFINVQSNLTSGDIPTILVDSVKVTATGLTLYRLGRDFSVRFDAGFNKCVFTDLNGALKDLGSTKSISYDWIWKRYAEKQEAAADGEPYYVAGWQ